MEKLDELVTSLSLPINLPEEAFTKVGKLKIPDFDIIFDKFLPSEIDGYLLERDNAVRCHCNNYFFPLAIKGQLVIYIENTAITKIYCLIPPDTLPIETKDMLKRIRGQS